MVFSGVVVSVEVVLEGVFILGGVGGVGLVGGVGVCICRPPLSLNKISVFIISVG